MSKVVVVVLPCVPATAMVRLWRAIHASVLARVHTVIPAALAACNSLFDAFTAAEYVTTSQPATTDGSCGTFTVTPNERSRSTTGDSRMSLPETLRPISARMIAIALVPGPPTPTM